MGLSLLVLDDRAKPAAPPAGPALPRAINRHAGRMIDSHGRTIRDLRISLTDRCNFRCLYCLEPESTFLDQRELLSPDEIVRLARVATSLGVEKIRLTGGEPTLHPRLIEIIERIARLPITDLAMTTNASWGPAGENWPSRWRAAGLRRLTVSIDCVDPARFAQITRSSTPLARVLDNVRAAQRAGLDPIRLNAVVIRGVNDDQVVPLAGLARELGVEVRFIEFMPLDAGRDWRPDSVVTAAEMLSAIQRVYPLTPRGRAGESSTSEDFAFVGDLVGRAARAGGVGFIAPVSRPFCGACSRLRITADGKVRPCLFSRQEWDIRPLLRGGGGSGGGNAASDEQIAEFLQDVTWTKQAGHGISSSAFVQPERTMSAIGG